MKDASYEQHTLYPSVDGVQLMRVVVGAVHGCNTSLIDLQFVVNIL
jgi:hypothetical protein